MRSLSILAAGSLALGVAGASATAAPDVFDVLVETVSATGFTENINFIDHQFGTSVTSPDFFPLTITSGMSDRLGWQYQIEIDYSLYDVGFFSTGTSTVDLLGIKGPDSPFPISEARAKDSFGNDIGTIVWDGGNIQWVGVANDILAGGELVTIQWNQIPAPGAIALLGLAGLAGGRRRR